LDSEEVENIKPPCAGGLFLAKLAVQEGKKEDLGVGSSITLRKSSLSYSDLLEFLNT
jgi:hypothetical protein